MIVDYAPTHARQRDGKRMLEVTQTEGKWHAKINYSSLDVINTCMRKAHYQLQQKLTSVSESSATLFGKSIHKALEHWYTLPVNERTLSSSDARHADDVIAFGHRERVYDGPLESIRRFVECADDLRGLADGDKRGLANGVKILCAYFRQYADDRLVVCADAAGLPLIERSFEFRMLETDTLIIDYHGTVDAVLRHSDSGETMVVDHKTTHALGKEFIGRAKPNHQFTGYIAGASRCMGVDTHLFMVNGIQVAKTKCEFMRVVTDRDDDDYQELVAAVGIGVSNFISSISSGIWAMSAPTSCAQWGGCQYLDACSVPKSLRANVLEAKYGQQ